jgi:hypothetical protein
MFKEQFRRGQLQNIRKVRCRANVPGINGVNHLYIVSHHCQPILLSSFTDHFSFSGSLPITSIQTMFLKSSIIFGLIAGVCATPVPQNPSNDLSKRVPQTDISYVSNPLDSRMASGVKFKDTTCPEYKITYTSKEISDAVKRENAKTSPGTYGNKEGNKALFATTEKLYKASLDSQSRTKQEYCNL